MSTRTPIFSESGNVPSFGLLSTGERNPAPFAVSIGINILIVILAIILGLTVKKVLVDHSYEMTELVVPNTHAPSKVKLPPPPKMQPPKVPEIKLEPSKINLPQPAPFPAPKPIRMEEVPPQVKFQQAKPNIVPAPEPKAAMTFASASVQRQPAHQTVEAVRFGEPLGARPNSTATHGVVMAAGFGSPNGGQERGSPHGTVGSTGIGEFSSGRGATAVIGHVASAGIPRAQKAVAIASFSRESSSTTNLEIIYKPPVRYTATARAKKIQGDVIVNVTFTASGRVIVHGVVSGLGYGLDEEARRVAKEIRFHPATRGGRPVDVTTEVTIAFQLA